MPDQADPPAVPARAAGVPASARETLTEALTDPDERARMGFDSGDDDPVPVIIELNIAHPGGLEPARSRLLELFDRVCPDNDVPVPVSGSMFKGRLTIAQSRQLVSADAEEPDRRRRAVYRIWPDFPLRPLVVR